MRISLLITTYNRKDALKLCVESAFRQTRLPDEIVVADDGSREDTAEIVHELTRRSPVPLLHSWQPDDGFRLAASRNRGIAASSGDYIVIVDGDLVLDSHFIEDHARFAKPRQWIQGCRATLSSQKTAQTLASGELRVGFFSKGVSHRKNMIRLPLLAFLLGRPWNRSLYRGIHGCNTSFWREDIDQANGFNETFVGWGYEDIEFAARLANLGIVRRNLRFAAIAYHLYHPENSKANVARNRKIMEEATRNGSTRCERGIDQYRSQNTPDV